MNDLKVFENNQFGQVRTIDRDGEPWFVAVDVCRALGLEQVTRAMDRLDDDERGLLKVTHPQNPKKMIDVNGVNEFGLYSLVLCSTKPEAKAFKRWITHEVIPAIRKTGAYATHSRFSPDDYLRAAQLLANCNTRALDAVYSLLRDAGFRLPELRTTQPNVSRKQPDRETIAAYLREEMARQGYNGTDVASMIGCTPMSVSRWTRGIVRPCSRYIQTIFEVFGSPDESR